MYELYIKQKVFKITDHYEVMDSNQNPVYRVDQDFRLVGNTVHVSMMDGSEAFVINKRVLTIMPKYDVDFSNGKTAFIKQKFTFFIKSIDMYFDNKLLSLDGSLWDLDFRVFSDNNEIGNISRKILAWGDTYVISVFAPEFEEALLALTIAVDNIKDNEGKG